MSDNDRPLYVMDDDYIEQKYVKAEEERQRKQEEDRYALFFVRVGQDLQMPAVSFAKYCFCV